MLDNKNIDDIFKKGLGNFQEEPSEELWLKVEKKLWLKKMLNLSKYIFIGASFIIIATLIYFSSSSKKEQNVRVNTSIQQQQNIAKVDINKNQVNTQENTNTSKTISNQDNTKDNINTKKETTQTSKTNNTSTTLSDTKKGLTTATNLPDSKNKINNKENKTLQKANNLKEKDNQKANQEELQKQTLQQSENTKKEASDLKINEQEFTQRVEKETLSKNPETSQTNTYESKSQTATNETKSQAQAEDTKTVKTETKNETSKTETTKTEKKPISTFKEPKIIEPLKPSYEILFYVMPSYVGKTLSGLTQEELSFRKANEKAHVFLNYGMEIRYRLKNFTIQTGVVQTQSGEKNNYAYKHLANVDTSGSHNDIQLVSYIDPQNSNNTIVTFDSTWVKEADSTFANTKLSNINVIKYIEIPLNIGYIFNVKKHQIGINGGVSCAMLSQVSVSLINNATNEVRQITKSDNVYKKTMWSYNVALSYSYLIGSNTSLYIQTGFKKNMNSVFSNSSTKQMYQFFDTKIGVMVKL